MTGVTKKQNTAQNERKAKSGLSNLKKKLSFPRIYKRLASKLSIHGRHFRSLTNTWTASDLQCMVSQYELTAMLKELSDAVELARPSARSITEDLLKIQKENYLCDLNLSIESGHESDFSDCKQKTVQLHSILFAKRTCIPLPQTNPMRKAHEMILSQSHKDSSVITLQSDSYSVLEHFQSQFSYIYNKTVQKLTLKSTELLPANFCSDLLSHIYGESPLELQLDFEKESLKRTFCRSKMLPVLTAEASVPIESDKLDDNLDEFVNVSSRIASDQKNIKQSSDEKCHALGNSLSPDSRNNESKFTEEFRNDMKDLLLSANVSGDVKLVCAVSSVLSVLSSHLRSRQPGLCCHCHSFVIAARSTFFRKVIQRHQERSASNTEISSPFISIELDWKVFSPRYFSVVLYAMYTDEVDLQRIKKTVPLISHRVAMESLSVDVKDLMELLYIGNFLDFSSLIQGCENSLLDRLNANNFVEMLQWSSQLHGSPWLRRQIIRYARENFLQLLANAVLFSLTALELAEVIQSDFVNAPELEILRTVLKWGEHELLRRIELREPNLVRSHVLLNQSTRNFRVSSTRRRELLVTSNTEELHDITAALLPHVRLRHVLPSNNEVLTSAIKRGVISCPPEHLLEWHYDLGSTSDNENRFFWLRCRAGVGFCPPRLFSPYSSEARAILEERLNQESSGSVNLKSVKRASHPPSTNASNAPASAVPDTLYMINQIHRSSQTSSVHAASCDLCRLSRIGVTSLATKRLKYIENRYPVPPPTLASKLIARERHLRQSPWIRKILQACHSTSISVPHCCCQSKRNSMIEVDGNPQPALLCNLCRAEGYIRLLAVREHDLPDVTSDVLRRPHLYYDPDELFAAHAEDARPDQLFVKATDSDCLTATSSKPLQKLFHKKAATINDQLTSLSDIKPNWLSGNGSSSDLSLSDDSSTEWPFPYRGLHMRDRNQPGSSFWGSDASIHTPPRHCVVPDVAASADSTLKSLRSQLSCSSSDSCSSVPCRLVAESRPPDSAASSGECPSTDVDVLQTPFTRRTPSLSYAHYLSMRKPKRPNSKVELLKPQATTTAATWSAVQSESAVARTRVRDVFPSHVLERVDPSLASGVSRPPDLCVENFNRKVGDVANSRLQAGPSSQSQFTTANCDVSTSAEECNADSTNLLL